jgi:NTP pyrophosphatase (non-canonical NTP hydrolase)
MKPLKTKPTLSDYQQYIREMIVERGFTDTTIPELFMYLSEETGELAKAVRQYTNMHCDDSSEKMEVAHELADVFGYVIDIANHLDVDLEKAFRDKEIINNRRVWKKKGEL